MNALLVLLGVARELREAKELAESVLWPVRLLSGVAVAASVALLLPLRASEGVGVEELLTTAVSLALAAAELDTDVARERLLLGVVHPDTDARSLREAHALTLCVAVADGDSVALPP